MKKVPFITLLLVATFSFLQMDCKKEEQIIPPNNKPTLGKRNYVWSTDTISYPGSLQTILTAIWGSSAKDVYIVGDNESPPGPGSIYHYDGVNWKPVNFHVANGGTIQGPVSFSGIYGFSKNDVWVVGERIIQNQNAPPNFLDSSFIIHFSGENWHQHYSNGRSLFTTWGLDSNQMWFGGREGTLFRKTNNMFSRIPVSDKRTIEVIVGNKYDSVYIQSLISENGVHHSILEVYSSDQFTFVDSTQPFPAVPKFGEYHLAMTKQGKIYTVGIGGIYEKSDIGWQRVVNTNAKAIEKIFVVSSNNIFGVGQGMIYHYNGADWHKYDSFSNLDIGWRDVWSDGNEVFIVGFSTQASKSIILHGK